MTDLDRTESLLHQAWNEEIARNSIERWDRLCEQQGLQGKPENLGLLIRIFGASWYFTRFIFANVNQAISIIDQETPPMADKERILGTLGPSLEHEDIEVRTNQLRILKNGYML